MLEKLRTTLKRDFYPWASVRCERHWSKDRSLWNAAEASTSATFKAGFLIGITQFPLNKTHFRAASSSTNRRENIRPRVLSSKTPQKSERGRRCHCAFTDAALQCVSRAGQGRKCRNIPAWAQTSEFHQCWRWQMPRKHHFPFFYILVNTEISESWNFWKLGKSWLFVGQKFGRVKILCVFLLHLFCLGLFQWAGLMWRHTRPSTNQKWTTAQLLTVNTWLSVSACSI